jgi:hypothetical protein
MTLISEGYRDLNRQLHAENPKYGTSGAKFAERVRLMALAMGNPTILDYGAGKGLLAQALPQLRVAEYDPAVPGKDAPPVPADLVVCTDVLEHIEPECLGAILEDLRRLMRGRGFFNIATRPAVKHLADGRNAHLIVQPAAWWRAQLEPLFKIQTWEPVGEGAVNCEVTPLPIGQHSEG